LSPRSGASQGPDRQHDVAVMGMGLGRDPETFAMRAATATASRAIWLKRSTLEDVKGGRIKKGDVLTAARLAAILTVKDTPRIIPMCHNIPITGVDVEFELEDERVHVAVTVTLVRNDRCEDGSPDGCCGDAAKYLGYGEISGEG
jgi:hypothetical protein